MGKNQIRRWLLLCFPVSACILLVAFIKIPDQLEWFLMLFVGGTAILDRLHTKVFSSYSYSFSIVILSLLIFDYFSIFYGLVYILVSFYILWLKLKPNFWFVLLPLFSIQLLTVIIANEFYNTYTDKDFLARYITLCLLLLMNVLFYYMAIIFETGRFSTAVFLGIFGPVLFEVIIIFPVLSYFSHFSYTFIAFLFVIYYLFIGSLHKKYLNINQGHIQRIIQRLNPRKELEVLFMDIGDIKGMYAPRKRLIVIDEKMDYPEQLQTFIHEWVHHKLWGKIRLIKPLEELLVTILEAIISWYYILMIHQLVTIREEDERELL